MLLLIFFPLSDLNQLAAALIKPREPNESFLKFTIIIKPSYYLLMQLKCIINLLVLFFSFLRFHFHFRFLKLNLRN